MADEKKPGDPSHAAPAADAPADAIFPPQDPDALEDDPEWGLVLETVDEKAKIYAESLSAAMYVVDIFNSGERERKAKGDPKAAGGVELRLGADDAKAIAKEIFVLAANELIIMRQALQSMAVAAAAPPRPPARLPEPPPASAPRRRVSLTKEPEPQPGKAS